jgi:Fic family protein
MKGLAGRIREILKDRRKVSVDEIVNQTEASRSQVLHTLDYMEKRGELELVVEKTVKKVKNWKPVEIFRGSGEVADKVWKAMRYCRKFTTNDIIKITGASAGAVKNYVHRWRAKGFIEKVGFKKQAFVYRIVKDQVKRPSSTWRTKK